MNFFKALKLFRIYRKFESIEKEKTSMKIKIPRLLTLFGSLSATVGLPLIVGGWVHAHPTVYLGIVAAAVVLHAILPSIFAAPSAVDLHATGLDKTGILLLTALLFGGVCQAQAVSNPSPIQAPAGFSAASSAMAIHYKGEWSAGTLVTESYDFLDFGQTKANHVYVEGFELVAPTVGLNVYGGKLRLEPNLAALMNKTNVTAGSFQAFFDVGAGNGVPSAGGSHIVLTAGGGVRYQVTPSLSWQTLEGHYGRFGSVPFAYISTGLKYVFAK